jgi:hypothetical protein
MLMPTISPSDPQNFPEPYGESFKQESSAEMRGETNSLTDAEERYNKSEANRVFWGRWSWWGPMRYLRQWFGLLLALTAFIGISLPALVIPQAWLMFIIWVPLLILTQAPIIAASESATNTAEAHFDLSAQRGNNHRSSPGSDRIEEALKDGKRNAYFILVANIIGVSLLIFATLSPPGGFTWNIVLLMVITIGFGTTVHSRITLDDLLNHADPLPFLALYAPTHHPTELSPAFSELVQAHLDPILGGEWKKWEIDMQQYFKPGLHHQEAMERLLLLLHLHYNEEISDTKLSEELNEFIFGGPEQLQINPTFNQSSLQRMIAHSCAWQPGFFQLIARLKSDFLTNSFSISNNSWRMDVEFEDECYDGQGHLFIFINNQSMVMDRVRVEVHVPGGQPEKQSFRLEVEPCPAPQSKLQLYSSINEDVIDWLPRYLRRGVFLWMSISWESGEIGLRTLQVNLLDDSGDILTSTIVRTNVRRRMGSGDSRRKRRLRRARTLGLTRTRKS